MSSYNALLKRDPKSESLLSRQDTSSYARTISASTHRTNITFFNCIRMLSVLFIWVEVILFIATWGLYVSRSETDQILVNTPFHMTILQAYYWVQIAVQSTMIIICMVFYIEFILYTDSDWISEVKKEKEQAKLKTISIYRSESTDGFPDRSIKKKKFGRKHARARSIISDCNICSRLCSFGFCFRRIGAGIVNIFTLTWSELHILCMMSCIYYLLAAMLRLYHFNQDKTDSRYLFTITDLLTGFGIIMPPFAYNLCSRLKMIYDQDNNASDITVAGSQWEKSKGKLISSSQMSIVQASKSILNDKMMKFWMFIMFSFQFFIFVMNPILAPNKFRYYLNSTYDCRDSINHADYICDSTTSAVVFTVHILIIRIAVPLLLLNTVFSFTPKSSHTAQIIHYYNFYFILTPSSTIMITIFEFATNYFLSYYYVIVTWIAAGIILCVSLWQIYIFVRILTLAEDAENDQEQFYGFAQRLNASLFNYFSKGILYLILWFISFGALLITNSMPEGQTHKVYRQIPSIIFAATSMFLLVPLQKIAISPTYRSYFGRKNRVKYLVTFHIICLFSVIFIVDKIIFVATFYFDILENDKEMKDATFSTSFSLSFASIGFFIWLFGKYCGILYPIAPASSAERRSRTSKRSITEMSQMGNKSRNSKKRKDSKLSLTALYNVNRRISSTPLPLYDEDENENDDLKHDIGPAQSISPQRTKSLSIKPNKSLSKKDMVRNKSKKATSVSFQPKKLRNKHSVGDDPATYDDTAKRFGLKGGTISKDMGDYKEENI